MYDPMDIHSDIGHTWYTWSPNDIIKSQEKTIEELKAENDALKENNKFLNKYINFLLEGIVRHSIQVDGEKQK